MDEISEDDLQLSPLWRQAVRDFMAEGFAPGEIVHHEWLEQHFGLDAVDDSAMLTVAEHRKRQFKYLQSVEAFKQELLEAHRVCLLSVMGKGYRITPPSEQTALSMNKFEAEAVRVFRKAALRIKHVRVEELTDDQRRENIDAAAKLSHLRGMQKSLK
jgi:hypothetical protein